jgi:hypothetical protein
VVIAADENGFEIAPRLTVWDENSSLYKAPTDEIGDFSVVRRQVCNYNQSVFILIE